MNHAPTHREVLNRKYSERQHKLDEDTRTRRELSNFSLMLRKIDLRIALLQSEIDEKELLSAMYDTKVATNKLTYANMSINRKKALEIKAEARADTVLLERYKALRTQINKNFENAIQAYPSSFQTIMKKHWLENLGLTTIHKQIDTLGIEEEDFQKAKELIKELEL